MTTQAVPTGFEESHAEWLRLGGNDFRSIHRSGAAPAFYRSRYWKLVKNAVLTSREFKCCRCSGVANKVHHLNYRWIGEDHLHPESLAAVCGSCQGLIAYVSNAESLITRISRRISLCKGFMADRYREQNPAHICARLLGYRDTLDELRRLFATKTYYTNPGFKSEAEAEASSVRHQKQSQAYAAQAAALVSTWDGSDKEKAERLLPMLEAEIQNCRKFIADVFEPVSPRAGRLPSGAEATISAWARESRPAEARPDSANAAPVLESLVVGIQFHRGHLDGILPEDSVELVREPNNAYDPNAIQVKLNTGEILGYLTREFAAALAREMDAGMCPQARISRIVRAKIYVAISAVGH